MDLAEFLSDEERAKLRRIGVETKRERRKRRKREAKMTTFEREGGEHPKETQEAPLVKAEPGETVWLTTGQLAAQISGGRKQ